ncbi:nucleotidyltransferase domain-containing protein [Bacillus sp. 31A1R]|uniref:Nucleotidyltransferase domain-containing protein n=1 Tax=Robertmurraya mangrovi TaxID=3098077 RepID=A0ABU5J196_9BACI|nr:nucleotidyltransferase domain-containing protein [Bacillus sp. 31A1R]MDZ5473188.1 nucleotidyltransferase domain-containing protein [Bacillus sp. 31A1R]
MENVLRELEHDYNIEILFACEAGSHVWGSSSEDSDLDLRFIYKQKDLRSYLSLEKLIDVIEINNEIDIHGWDIQKALQLLRKSNPTLYEWAFSPVVYFEKNSFSEKLKQMIMNHYSPYSLVMHYIHLMARNIKEVKGCHTFNLKRQKQLIQAVKSVLICHNFFVSHSIRSPFFLSDILQSQTTNPFAKSYRQLVEAKIMNKVVPNHFYVDLLDRLEIEKVSLLEKVNELGRGNDCKDQLNEWLWELLNI